MKQKYKNYMDLLNLVISNLPNMVVIVQDGWPWRITDAKMVRSEYPGGVKHIKLVAMEIPLIMLMERPTESFLHYKHVLLKTGC